MFIFDAHLDLSMNALEWNRDLRLPVSEIRNMERGMKDKPDRGKNTVSLDAMRKGNIGLCVATQIARYSYRNNQLPGWNSQQQAWAQTQGQLAWYQTMVKEGQMAQITNVNELKTHLELWDSNADNKPIGFVLSLEGADSIVDIDYLDIAYENGLRAIGPAHYGPGVYAFGTDAMGGIGDKGKALLKKMQSLNIILDATHLCDQSFWEAMNAFDGPIWASHSNCRSLVNHNRQFNDQQLMALIEKGAVIGMPLDAWMMVPNWVRGQSNPKDMGVSLEKMVDNIDHICQLAGNSKHVGLGTDLDGAFGKEQSPYDLDTIADLQLLPELLTARGYKSEDVENIMHANFIQFLYRAWQ
ncbi:dipeptidase [Muricauda sp. 2012CJ35-5]|uniref:Dipeptidase n=1 Tax=Flagellimonas spongiicola TaxID=2942208 RepID=A0ABT0PQ66_9FLAO|nr:membrane dipeptidase [Allomuricauda spongiicola]MCL6273116.1 dipeptidase [Allomuricauda spongiicola]